MSAQSELRSESQSKWTSLVLPILGVMVGGSISLLGLWIKELRDARTAARRWIEEEYVFGASAKLLNCIHAWRLDLLMWVNPFPGPLSEEGLPVSAIGKLGVLLGSNKLEDALIAVGQGIKKRVAHQERGAAEEAVKLLTALGDLVVELQHCMLRLDVGDKTKLFAVQSNPEIGAIRERLALLEVEAGRFASAR